MKSRLEKIESLIESFVFEKTNDLKETLQEKLNNLDFTSNILDITEIDEGVQIEYTFEEEDGELRHFIGQIVKN